LVTLIDEQSVVLNDLTTRLLKSARLEGAEIHLRREECGARELIDEVLEPFAADFSRRPVRIVIPDPEIRVYGDCGLIVTALQQLVDNAIKYSDPETAVTISAELSSGEIVISVHNEGRPIRPEDRERIFDRFYRSPDTERRAAGTGLGLSITKKIADAHQGRVWARSGEAGVCFNFALPLGHSLPSSRAQRVEDSPSA
jgi:two-component system sensor histidine kinase KdpD